MTTISNLPSDLAEEILSRIPLKSLRAVRFTCKKWNSLTKTRGFIELHIDKAATRRRREGESQMMAMMTNNNLRLISVVNGTDVDDPYIEDKGMLTFTCLNDSDKVDIAEVFHCEGLLLFVLNNDIRLVVWNPYWGQPRWIESSPTSYPYNTRYRSYPALGSHDKYNYALGYINKKNKSCCSHKILKFRDDFDRGNKFFCYEIYDFDSNTWTILNVIPHWRIYNDRGISLKGNTYWCAKERNAYGYITDYAYIICFNFSNERFGPLMAMPYTEGNTNARVFNLSCVTEEKLAALFLHCQPYNKIQICVTTKIEAEKMSWCTFFTVDTGPAIKDLFRYRLGSFFIDEEMKAAMVVRTDRCDTMIIGEDGYFREVNLGEAKGKGYLASACSYFPSLVQIKECVDGKRKKQSDLDKCRSEKKMLRLEKLLK